VHEAEKHRLIRAAARAYEERLPLDQRKQLGQFFTGLPLGRLLAHLALQPDTKMVLDPMAGNGDLLDAVWEAATERDIHLERLDGIEIDEQTAEACAKRLAGIFGSGDGPIRQIVSGDAFESASLNAFEAEGYDLVITNPPYVRYQTHERGGAGGAGVRLGLIDTIGGRLSGTERDIWKTLAEGYSGLSDLSIPAWLLAASLVRPGGTLALVAPATWRSRDYADVVRYLLLRCFSLECIVEEKQPRWFSSALVRTHLLVARRLESQDALTTLGSRTVWSSARWLQVSPQASSKSSLVGTAFDSERPEMEFARWVQDGCGGQRSGISARNYELRDEWASVKARVIRHSWYYKVEASAEGLPLFSSVMVTSSSVPEPLSALFEDQFGVGGFVTLEEAGIQVGQGLRTGCNGFFYVSCCGEASDGFLVVRTSDLFAGWRFSVPLDAIRPVLVRQAEVTSVAEGRVPNGRVLDLRRWVLPEDFGIVSAAHAAYAKRGETLPCRMPIDLAAYVRMAAKVSFKERGSEKRIPDLSAVTTNVRLPRKGQTIPRFWYMLPDFAARHLPAAFVARVNHGLPWAESNLEPPILIDANFSTLWAPRGNWTRYALKALLNSGWCRALMESLGTPMGGGALKLEAAHLRQLHVPLLSDADKERLDALGKDLTKGNGPVSHRIDEIILGTVLSKASSRLSCSELARAINDSAQISCLARQRASS